MPEMNSRLLLERLLRGDPDAAQLIFSRYFERMSQLARKRMSIKIQSRCDAQDIAQAALCTFFEQALKKTYTIQRDDDLWRLLAAITINKANQQIQFHRAAKRSVDKETWAERAPNQASLCDRPSPEPSAENAIALADELQSHFQFLEPIEWQILQLRLKDMSVADIAEQLRYSTRTIGRMLRSIRTKLKQRVLPT